MEIAEEKYVSRFQCLFHHKFCMVEHGILLAARAYPLPIQILSNNGTSVIANNDSIRVKHGDDFEYEGIS